MIRSNLSILLAERNIRISRVSHDTKISRTTLTALTQNNCKGVQFDTLNTLCKYLKVEPNELIKFYPLDIENFEISDYNESLLPDVEGKIYFDLVTSDTKYTVCAEFSCCVDVITTGYDDLGNERRKNLYSANVKKFLEEDGDKIADIIKKVPVSFLSDMERIIINEVYKVVHFVDTEKNEFEYSFKWDALK